MATRRGRDEAGAVALLAAGIFLVLFLICALVIDLGLARDVRRESQNASDASALAAANALYPDGDACASVLDVNPPCFHDAVVEARGYAATNFGVTDADWLTCSDPSKFWVVSGTTDCVSFTDDAEGDSQPSNPTKVRVLMPLREVDVGFGASAQVDHVDISSDARASVDAGASATCGLCFLGPIDAGNADFTVTGGGIHVNGDLSAGPNAEWTADDAIGVVGTVSGGVFNPAHTPAPSVTDPWAARTDLPPSVVGLPQKNDPCGSSGGPGIYGSEALESKQICALSPGLYVIVGTWSQKNKSEFTGSGVTLYFTCGTKASPHVCASGEAGGELDAKNGEVTLSAPPTGGLAGVAIVYDRENTQYLGLQGNGGTSITGAVYAPSSKLDFNGNSCFGFSGGPVIVSGVIKANGNTSCVTIDASIDAEIYSLPGEIALDR